MMVETKDLIVGTDLTAVNLYTVEKINVLLKEIEKKALAVKLPDASTDKNRKEIISHSFRATTSKTMIIKGAEKITVNWRKDTKTVNGVKKIAEEFLTDLAKKIRQPVTDWEKAEEERTRVTAECLRFLTMARMVAAGTSSALIMEKITEVDGYEFPEIDDETTLESLQEEQETTLTTLRDLHDDAVTNEKEKEELAALRKDKEDREKKELDEAAEKKQKEEAAKVEESRVATEKQDEIDRLANEERIKKETEERLKKEAEEKLARETRQKEDAEKLKREEEDKRISDINHRKEIHLEAINSIVSLGIADEDTATAMVEAVSQDQVDHMDIAY